MKPHIAVFDDFVLPGLAKLIDGEIASSGFRDIVSEWDGVTYPGICPLPKYIFEKALTFMLGERVETIITFARLTSAAQPPAPNQIHPDTVMSQYALLIYWSHHWAEGAGTSFWDHKSEGRYHTEETDSDRVRQDSNERSEWSQYFLAQGQQNRALIYDSRLYHCAEPVGGFGSGPEDGRIVLTSFFNLG